MATDIKKLADELVNMTILEVNELKTYSKTNMASSQPPLQSQLLLLLPKVARLPLTKNLNSTSF